MFFVFYLPISKRIISRTVLAFLLLLSDKSKVRRLIFWRICILYGILIKFEYNEKRSIQPISCQLLSSSRDYNRPDDKIIMFP